MLVATGTSKVALIDTRDQRGAGGLTVPGATRAVAAAPDGARGFVTAGRGLAVLDLNARTVLGGVPLTGVPAALAVSPDGTRVYAARRNGIEVIDPLAITRVGVRKLAGTPLDLAVTPTRAIVVQAGGKVAVLDLATGRRRAAAQARGRGGRVDRRGRAGVGVGDDAAQEEGQARGAARAGHAGEREHRRHGQARDRRRRRRRRLAGRARAIVAPGAKLTRHPPQGGARRPATGGA